MNRLLQCKSHGAFADDTCWKQCINAFGQVPRPVMYFMMEHMKGNLFKLALYYVCACSWKRGKTFGRCFNVDRTTVSNITGIAKGQIFRYDQDLVAMGFITKTHVAKGNSSYEHITIPWAKEIIEMRDLYEQLKIVDKDFGGDEQ
jgi:hypothetical protein